jgi:PTH1 family peptidyl-tRNA hydrolase
MFLILGLGNPGARYTDTRHNIGFLVVDALARRAMASLDREQHGALVAKATVAGQPVVLAKPQKFMNLSGGPGQLLRDFYKVDNAHVIVVHDDMDLPAGEVRLKQGGGHGGHNGLRDLIARMGADFVRVRAGVGRPPAGWDPADYVLGRWSNDEAASLASFVDTAADAVQAVVTLGLARATAQLHAGPSRPAKPAPPLVGGAAPKDRSMPLAG